MHHGVGHQLADQEVDDGRGVSYRRPVGTTTSPSRRSDQSVASLPLLYASVEDILCVVFDAAVRKIVAL